jgi:hypothetical protein
LPRAGTTYRAYRRNKCREDKGVWPAGGVQLDPVRYRPTADYSQAMKATTPEMFAAGRRWIREVGRKLSRKAK